MTKVERRGDIQGLRGIAVLSVVIYHATEGRLLSGGFLGVDIFFVLSGFLITGIIKNDLEADKYSIIEFYSRRARRLLPALSVLLVTVLFVGMLILSPPFYVKTAQSSLATLLFSSNMYFMLGSGYFEDASILKPLLHTWSLSVEEQFYLFYPIIVAMIYKTRKKLMLPAIICGILFSFALQIALLKYSPAAAFFLAPARAYELFIGAVLVFVRPSSTSVKASFRMSVALGALIGLLVLLVTFKSSALFPGFPALVVAILTAAILWSQPTSDTLVGSVLRFPALTWFGDISYSLYLWHWPLLVFGRHWALGDIPLVEAGGLVVVAIIMGWISYALVEKPLNRQWGNVTVFKASALTVAVLIAASTIVIFTRGFESRLGEQSRVLLAARQDHHPQRALCHADDAKIITTQNACVFGDLNYPPEIAVWGDSHAAELSFALGERIRGKHQSLQQFSASACPPALEYISGSRPSCRIRNDVIINGMLANANIRTVYLVMNYSGYPERDRPLIIEGFVKVVDRLTMAGKEVAIFSPVPTMEYDPPAALQMLNDRGEEFSVWGESRSQYDYENRPYTIVLQELGKRRGVRIIDSASALCDVRICPAYKAGAGVLYFNAEHLSLAGARVLSGNAMGEPLPLKSILTPPLRSRDQFDEGRE